MTMTVDLRYSEKRKEDKKMDMSNSQLIQRKIQKEARRYKVEEEQLVQAVSYLYYRNEVNHLEADIFRSLLPNHFDFEPAENVLQFISDHVEG